MRCRVGWALSVLSILLLTWMVSPAQAQQGTADRGPRGAHPEGQRILDLLDLTEEQQTKIDEIRSEGRSECQALHKEIMRLDNRLHGEMLEDEPDAGKARGLVEKIGEFRTRIQILRLERRIAIRKVLTPEQRDHLLVMRSRKGHRMMRQGGDHAGWGPDCMHYGTGCGYHGPGCGHRGSGSGHSGPGCGHHKPGRGQHGPGCGHHGPGR